MLFTVLHYNKLSPFVAKFSQGTSKLIKRYQTDDAMRKKAQNTKTQKTNKKTIVNKNNIEAS